MANKPLKANVFGIPAAMLRRDTVWTCIYVPLWKAQKGKIPLTVLPLKVMENSAGFWGSGFLELETLGGF